MTASSTSGAQARSARGRVAVVGVGESAYFRRGHADKPEFCLALDAVEAACADADVDVREVDGFASFGADRNLPSRLAAAFGVPELRLSSMQWESGGGGAAGAVGNAAAAISSGIADCVIVYRAIAQGEFGRLGERKERRFVQGESALSNPYGLLTFAQSFALQATRYMHDHGIEEDALEAVVRASYHHAQSNPRAVMYGRPLSSESYRSSRWIVEPFRLYDCCQESDGAAAMLLVSAERASHMAKPVYLLGVAQGGSHRSGASAHNQPLLASAGFTTVAERAYQQARVTPADVDVIQSYENFSVGVIMSLVEHGFCSVEDVNSTLTLDNLIAPSGRLPLNTSGGNFAECYVHGLGLQVEAVRQLRGESCNQVPGARVALASAGPMVPVVSTAIYGTAETLE